MGRVLLQTGDALDEDNLRDFFPKQNAQDFFQAEPSVNADFTADEVTVGTATAFIAHSGGLYRAEPDSDTLTLPNATGENYLYATFDANTDDSAQWEVTDTKSNISEPKLQKATIDTSSDTVDSSHNTDPDVTATAVTAKDGRFEGEPWFDVRAFGAVGDGSTDDTAALQNAFDIADGGGRVYIPEGQYYTTYTVLFGSDTEIVWHPNAEILFEPSDNRGTALVSKSWDGSTTTSNTRLINPEVNAVDASLGNGIGLPKATNVEVVNPQADTMAYHLVDLAGAQNCRIRGGFAKSLPSAAIQFDNLTASGGLIVEKSDGTVENAVVDGTNVEHVSVRGFSTEQCARPFYFHRDGGKHITIMGGTHEVVNGELFYSDSATAWRDMTIMGVSAEGGGAGSIGFNLNGTHDSFTAQGNTLFNFEVNRTNVEGENVKFEGNTPSLSADRLSTWTFNEESGTLLRDPVGGWDGKAVNSPTQGVAGVRQTAYEFPDTSQEHVDVGQYLDNDGLTEFTILWHFKKPDATASGTAAYFISKDGIGGNAGDMSLVLNGDVFAVRGEKSLEATTTVVDGNYHVGALTFDGDTLRLYTNPSPGDAPEDTLQDPNFEAWINSADLILGMPTSLDTSYASSNTLDDITILDHALNSQQLAAESHI